MRNRQPPLLLLPLATLLALCAGCASDPGADGAAESDPWADRVVAFTPGSHAGFGEANLPDVVLGGPRGRGESAGSLHVVSLGCGGRIVLAFDDQPLRDGPGADLLVFENSFSGWTELAEVAVSADGQSWHAFPCDPATGQGCAGVNPVLADVGEGSAAEPGNNIDPLDPATAGGDAFDLADLPATATPTTLRYVRLTDLATRPCEGTSGGFDLDALAALHGEAP